jgi:hypothetical protein
MRILLLICASSLAYGQAEFLPSPRTLHREGVVVEATTGEPIAGVEIKATAPAPGGGKTESMVVTDSAGRFRIDTPKARYANEEFFFYTKDGYLWQQPYSGDQLQDASGDIHQIHMVLRLLALATIRGVVLDAHRKPSSKALVSAMRAGNLSPTEATAGPKGEFQIRVVPGSYAVCARPQDPYPTPSKNTIGMCYLSATDYDTATMVTMGPGEISPPLTIHLGEMRLFDIRGIIAPVHKGWGSLIVAQADESGSGVPSWSIGCIKRDGTFIILGIPAGTYTLSATAGMSVESTRCDRNGRPEMIFANDVCCATEPKPQATRPRAIVYSGERRVTVTGNMNGVVVKVKREDQ